MQRKRRASLLVTALLNVVLLSSPQSLRAQASQEVPASEEIVRRMVEQNSIRRDQLKSYTSTRNYTVTYRGVPKNLTAGMLVNATYSSPSTKHFQVLSQTGSKLLGDRVLKKLLDSEADAAHNPDQTAVSPANYTFTFLAPDHRTDCSCYVFKVEPKVASKFLYRGKIWVDTQDFAIAQIDAEPAKNPSFWTKKTRIRQVYAKFGQFWLPTLNRSETSVRLGGTAELVIEYGAYQVEPQ